MLGLADTAESPEHNDTEQESPVQHNTFAAASSTPLPKQSPHVPRTSLEEAQQGIKQPFDPVVQSAQSAQAVPKTQPSVYQVWTAFHSIGVFLSLWHISDNTHKLCIIIDSSGLDPVTNFAGK